MTKPQELSPSKHDAELLETIKLYQDTDPDFSALLKFLYESSKDTNGSRNENETARIVFMNQCLSARLAYKGRFLTLDELKEALDDYASDDSKIESEKAILRQTEVSPDDTGPIIPLLLSQIKGYRNVLSKIQTTDSEDTSSHCGFSAECLLNSIRTRRFLQAIKQRVSEIEARNPSRDTIHVIDAGCGAIPIMGIYAALCSNKVKVTCIEHEKSSHALASQIIHDIELGDRITVHHEDAEQFTPSKNAGPIHLVISETMNHGFYDEGITFIMNHLKQFSEPDTFFIPDTVELGLVFQTCHTPRELEMHDFSGFFDHATQIGSWSYIPGSETKVVFDVPLEPESFKENGYLGITTKVTLRDKVELKPGESHITVTTPLPEHFSEEDSKNASALKLSYHAGSFDSTFEFSFFAR